ncbi:MULTISPECIES: hypothetical protein [Clostridium]|uniref:Uncharacterized protein n=1 Tax=Clostridium frigoriphilum TaxID=443253 RepID=A0ABU7UKQ2_9CLOT|nr:hypothetical protein [Clostridium sp. DSM 17811]MBU3098397.1 hypothetical protein [Clostridium sp. DSM 17811]
MRELKLGSWIIRVFTSNYTLWSSEDKVMVEFNSLKIATISIDSSDDVSINSKDSICDINKEQGLITIVYSNDPNMDFD